MEAALVRREVPTCLCESWHESSIEKNERLHAEEIDYILRKIKHFASTKE